MVREAQQTDAARLAKDTLFGAEREREKEEEGTHTERHTPMRVENHTHGHAERDDEKYVVGWNVWGDRMAAHVRGRVDIEQIDRVVVDRHRAVLPVGREINALRQHTALVLGRITKRRKGSVFGMKYGGKIGSEGSAGGCAMRVRTAKARNGNCGWQGYILGVPRQNQTRVARNLLAGENTPGH